MAFKFENIAEIGETIKSFSFKPFPDREDMYVQGKVIAKGDINHPTHGNYYKGYTVIAEVSTDGNIKQGDTFYVPFELSFMDFDERVSKVD